MRIVIGLWVAAIVGGGVLLFVRSQARGCTAQSPSCIIVTAVYNGAGLFLWAAIAASALAAIIGTIVLAVRR